MTTPTDTINNNNNEIYWTVPQIYDYLSIQGLNTKFGLNSTDFDIFIIKELIDNALDFIERNAKDFVNRKHAFVNVIITEENNGQVVKIKVQNSNAGIKNIFTVERVRQIFTLQNFHGSKRYTHKLNRGELGDALKAILCIPYAIAVHNYHKNDMYKNWSYPLEINTSNDEQSIKIRVDNVDKIRKKETPYIDPKPEQFHNNKLDDDDEDFTDCSEKEINDYYNNNQFTEFVVYLPKTAVNYREINKLLEKYTVLNTHIYFKFKTPISKKDEFYPVIKINWKLKNDWRNKESIYSYSSSEIKDSIQGIDPSHNHLNVYDYYIRPNFREGTTLSKKNDEIINSSTIGDLKSDYKKIEYIVQKMKDGMRPIKKQSGSNPKLDMPFDIELRDQALKQRLRDVYFIDTENFFYKRFDRYYEDFDDDFQFPFKLEVIIAKSSIIDKNRLTLIESLNFSPSLHPNSLFHSKDFIFAVSKKITVSDIHNILSKCGYNIYNETKHRKPYNLMIVNLISPRIDYNSHNKSDINLKPFAKIFSNEFVKFCKSPNKKNKNQDDITENNKHHLRIWLKERWDAVQKNSDLLITGRLTLDGVYYRLRTKLDRLGIPIRDRDYIKTQIREICENEMGLKRSQLGIMAADRAQFYYKGRTYNVGIDDISKLEEFAADIVIIEKQGAVEALAPFADKYGIALLYTRGFATEYALELIEKTKSNVIVLTDLDASGLLIQTKLPSNKRIYRIGVDQKMLDHFNLDFNDVSETYNPESHYDKVAEYLEDSDYNLISRELFERLKTERVEIDSILSHVTNEEFWEYIVDFLGKKFEYRNYNRTIDVRKSVIPGDIQKLIDDITNVVGKAQEPERENIMNELEHTREIFEDIEEEQKKINNRLISFAENDPDVKNKVLDLTKNFSFNN